MDRNARFLPSLVNSCSFYAQKSACGRSRSAIQIPLQFCRMAAVARKRAKKTGQKRPRAIGAERLSLTLTENSGRALFAQIREHVRDLIARGLLVPGMRLPPVRALARQLGVNQITVARAYRELADSGLMEGRRGGGSFIRASGNHSALSGSPDATAPPLLAERLFELARAPGVIAFTSNYPEVDEATVAEFRDCISFAASEKLDACFRYDPPLGRPELRRQIQIYLKDHAIDAGLDNVMVTSGAQQAIDLSVRTLVPPGSPVIVEQPAYYGAINALRSAHARILEVPLEHDGMTLKSSSAIWFVTRRASSTRTRPFRTRPGLRPVSTSAGSSSRLHASSAPSFSKTTIPLSCVSPARRCRPFVRLRTKTIWFYTRAVLAKYSCRACGLAISSFPTRCAGSF